MALNTTKAKNSTALQGSFHQIADNLPDALLLISNPGIITGCNSKAAKALEYSKNELIGKPLVNICQQPKNIVLQNIQYCFGSRNPIKLNLKLLKASRQLMNCSLSGSLFEKSDDKSLSTIVIKFEPNLSFSQKFIALNKEVEIQKMTLAKLRNSEKKLLQSNQELLIANQRAEAANHAKSIFLSTVSHEMRTPLHQIMGFADILQNQQLPIDSNKHANHIVTSAKALLSLLNDVIDNASLETGDFKINQQLFHISSILSPLATLYFSPAHKKGIELNFDIDDVTHPCVVADKQRIVQFLSKLVDNALKFTQQGHITVRVSQRGDKLTFSVEDTGIGIKPENLQKILQPLTQGEESLAREHGGLGLGLSLAEQIINAMEGKLNIESTPGKGSCFSAQITAPFEQCPASMDEQILPAKTNNNIEQHSGTAPTNIDGIAFSLICDSMISQLESSVIDDKTIETLKNLFQSSGNLAILDPILAAIENFDFDDASQQLKQLQSAVCEADNK